MKKLLIGLLLIAAAGAAYYLLVIKKKTSPTVSVTKDLLTGSWQIDSVALPKRDTTAISHVLAMAADSSILKNIFSFDSTGLLIQYTADTTRQSDTSGYEWAGSNTIYIRLQQDKERNDSFFVERLVKDSLVLATGDSARFYLTKLK